MITKILKSSPQSAKTVPPHPHFGGKQPNPPKCISVLCREEKESLEKQLLDIQDELDDTRRDLERANEELSKCNLVINVHSNPGLRTHAYTDILLLQIHVVAMVPSSYSFSKTVFIADMFY